MRACSVRPVLFACLLSLASPVHAADPAAPPGLLSLPDVRQDTVYACGAGALQAVLAYYGIDARQDTLIEKLGTNAKVGTRWWEIVRVAKSYGLDAQPIWNMDQHALEVRIDRHEPVILALQAWVDPHPPSSAAWEALKDDGHYVVLVGYDTRRYYFEDPAMFGLGYIEKDQLAERWHDYDEYGNRLDRFGITFDRPTGPDPLPRHLFPID